MEQATSPCLSSACGLVKRRGRDSNLPRFFYEFGNLGARRRRKRRTFPGRPAPWLTGLGMAQIARTDPGRHPGHDPGGGRGTGKRSPGLKSCRAAQACRKTATTTQHHRFERVLGHAEFVRQIPVRFPAGDAPHGIPLDCSRISLNSLNFLGDFKSSQGLLNVAFGFGFFELRC